MVDNQWMREYHEPVLVLDSENTPPVRTGCNSYKYENMQRLQIWRIVRRMTLRFTGFRRIRKLVIQSSI